jgi:nicotinamidase-related amidase
MRGTRKTGAGFVQKNGLAVFHIEHVSDQAGATFFLPGSDGVAIHEQVRPTENEKVIVKHFPDSFLGTELQACLKASGIRRLVVCGMMSHMCVDTTVRAASALGYEVILLGDACTTKDLIWQDALIPAKTVHGAFMAALQGTLPESSIRIA